MQKLGSILFQARDSAGNSGNALVADLTADEIRRRRIPSSRTPPPHGTCVYCGALLPHKGLVIGERVVLWSPSPIRCNCNGAEEYWRDIDLQALPEEDMSADQATAHKSEDTTVAKPATPYLSAAGIRKRFATRTFASYATTTDSQRQAWQATKEYADSFHRHRSNGEGLYIEGTNGTGKTHLAAAIALQLLEQGYSVICQTSIDLLNNIKDEFGGQLAGRKVLSAYTGADLLILDDLGKEHVTDWSATVMYSILNERYEDMKPVIITTNYNEGNLIKRLTPQGCSPTRAVAILSRLKESSSVITMAWDDYRPRRPASS